MFLPGKNGKGQTWELVLKYLNNFKNLSVLITEWVNQFFFHEGYQMIQFFLSLPVYMYKMIYAVYFKFISSKSYTYHSSWSFNCQWGS